MVTDKARILQHTLSIALYQYGERSFGYAYRIREENGVKLGNFYIEILILNRIYTELGSLFLLFADSSTSNKAVYFLTKSLQLLFPWKNQLELLVIDRIDAIDEEKSDFLYECMLKTDCLLAGCYYQKIESQDWGKAICYSDFAICYALKIGEVEKRTECLYNCMICKGEVI